MSASQDTPSAGPPHHGTPSGGAPATILVESDSVRGTTFRVELPRSPAEAA
jgi:hypothetical protein